MQQDVIAAYLRPWRRGASALKFASALGQIEFLIAILRSDAAAADAQRTALCSGLDAILTQLRTATGVS